MNKKKILILVLGIVLAAAVVVGLIFGVKALLKRSSEPAEPVSTGDTAGETVPSGGTEPVDPTATEPVDPTATEPEDPAMAAVRTKEFYTEDDVKADDARLDEIVAQCGDYQINSRQAQIFYGMQYVSFMSSYGAYASYFGLDDTKPLKDQSSMSPNLTWEQYFLMSAMEQFQQYAAVATASKAAGYVLPEKEQADLEEFLGGLTEEGAAYGFESADAYLQDSFGSIISAADYEAYLQLYIQAMSYENSVYLSVNPSDEDLEAYRQEHAEDFEDTDLEEIGVDVRHILFLSDADQDGTSTDEEKAAAKAKAEAMLAEYLTDPTEEHFAELANLNSEDPGSNTKGGLYENISQNTDFVEPFKNWCLDSARQIGDTDIVETDYGFHVMYFAGRNLAWKTTARDSIREAHITALVDEATAAYPGEIFYEKLVLSPLPMAEAKEE